VFVIIIVRDVCKDGSFHKEFGTKTRISQIPQDTTLGQGLPLPHEKKSTSAIVREKEKKKKRKS
jgi:hypothetical protein